MGRRLLTKSEIGAGFFDSILADAKKKLHAHAVALAKTHGSHVKKHVTKSAHALYKAKDRKAELNKIKTALVQQGVAGAHALTEVAKKKGLQKVEQLKQKAVAKVRSRVCGDVGSGFFDSIGGFFKNIFGKAKQAGAAAVKQGVHHVKAKIAAAPTMLKKHLIEHKDQYIAAAKDGLMDVAMNGKAGIARQADKAKKHMVKKARSVAGCKGSGLGMRGAGIGIKGAGGKRKQGRGLSVRGAGGKRGRGFGGMMRKIKEMQKNPSSGSRKLIASRGRGRAVPSAEQYIPRGAGMRVVT